jgi:uncharacterized DUF497 family protein
MVEPFEWDKEKAENNFEKHGVPFDIVHGLHWPSAIVTEDTRRDYGETRYRIYLTDGLRLYVLVATPRKECMRIISLRKANRREIEFYEQAQENNSPK